MRGSEEGVGEEARSGAGHTSDDDDDKGGTLCEDSHRLSPLDPSCPGITRPPF